jgi:GNAT superfamily N-acetyltransferase
MLYRLKLSKIKNVSDLWGFMRRKVMPVTFKTLDRSGLECVSCLRWEGISTDDDTERRRLKAESVHRAIKSWGEFGKIVSLDDQVLAFAQYAPAEFWPGIKCFGTDLVSDDAVLLTCLNVQPPARGQGLGRILLQSIEAGLVKRKIKAIEVFTTRGEDHPPGPIEFYLQNGFYIARDDPRYPLLRLELKALVGWQINIQFALDRIIIPARVVVAPPAQIYSA